jgi:hypothetical protein
MQSIATASWSAAAPCRFRYSVACELVCWFASMMLFFEVGVLPRMAATKSHLVIAGRGRGLCSAKMSV